MPHPRLLCMATPAVEADPLSVDIMGATMRALIEILKAREREDFTIALGPDGPAEVQKLSSVALNAPVAPQVEVDHFMLEGGAELPVPAEVVVIGDRDGQQVAAPSVLHAASAHPHPRAEKEGRYRDRRAKILSVQLAKSALDVL